jgi:hypothetical protein
MGPGSVEQNRWPRVWLLTTCGACTSRCIISYPRRGWSDEVLLALVREYLLPEMTRKPPVAAWIVDDMGLPKKSRHSVGVTRQYSGQAGKQDNSRAPFFVSRCTNLLSRSVACKRYAWSSESPDTFSVGFIPRAACRRCECCSRSLSPSPGPSCAPRATRPLASSRVVNPRRSSQSGTGSYPAI